MPAPWRPASRPASPAGLASDEAVGYNSRLDELQAAILRVKLPHIEETNAGRRRAAYRSNELLKDVSGILTPYEDPKAKHVYHQYTVRVLGGFRDELKDHLAAAGIGTMVYYPVPVHRLPIYKDAAPTLPVAEQLAGQVLSLPIWLELKEEVQVIFAGTISAASGSNCVSSKGR